jgi:hypothetical protein
MRKVKMARQLAEMAADNCNRGNVCVFVCAGVRGGRVVEVSGAGTCLPTKYPMLIPYVYKEVCISAGPGLSN